MTRIDKKIGALQNKSKLTTTRTEIDEHRYSTMVPMNSKEETLTDMEEPLLKEEENGHGTSASCNNDANPSLVERLPRALAILVFAMGAAVGLVSQLLLEKLMGVWQESIQGHSVAPFQHFLFSMGLASLLCLIVVGAEYLVPLLRGVWMEIPSAPSTARDSIIGQESWCYATGAACSICGFWLFVEFWRVPLPLPDNVFLETMACTISAFSILYVALLPTRRVPGKNSKASCQNNLHGIIAFGLLFGAASQLIPFALVSYFANVIAPIHSHSSMIFNVCWGLSTMLWVAGGLWTFRTFFPNMLSSSFHSIYNAESFFIATSLLGVALALIVLDIYIGTSRQLLPSLFILCMTPIFFHVILSADHALLSEEELDDFDESSSLEHGILCEEADPCHHGDRLQTRQQHTFPIVY